MADVISFENYRKKKQQEKLREKRRQAQSPGVDTERMKRLQSAFQELLSYAQEQTVNGEAQALGFVAGIEITDSRSSIELSMPVQEYSKEDIFLSLTQNVLTIKVFPKNDKRTILDPSQIEKTKVKPLLTQSIPIPHAIDDSGTKAWIKEGKLRIHLPKKPFRQQDVVRIEIQED